MWGPLGDKDKESNHLILGTGTSTVLYGWQDTTVSFASSKKKTKHLVMLGDLRHFQEEGAFGLGCKG